MKHLKHISILLFVVLALVLLLTPKAEAATVASGTCGAEGDNLTWTLDDEGTLTISGTGAMTDWNNSSHTKAPWYADRYNITSVVIANGVTTVGNYAFYNFGLRSLDVSESVVEIGEFAFNNCYNLSVLNLPDTAISIYQRTFMGTAWYTAQPNGVVYAGKVACGYKGTSAAEVIIQDGTLAIARKAFYNNDKLNSIITPGSVKSIDEYAFYDCDSLASVTMASGLETIHRCAFDSCSKLTSLTIPNSVKHIGYSSFGDCSDLTTVILGSDVETIEGYAFSNCTYLTSITFGDKIKSIGESAFEDTEWYESQPNGVIYAGKLAYQYKGYCSGTVTIKSGTLVIGKELFYKCIGLTAVTIPDSVVEIGDYAFYGCTNLKGTIKIPSKITKIGISAFVDCSGLTGALKIPNSTTTIGENAFSGCAGLSSLTIGSGLTEIEDGTFYGCSGLTGSVVIPDNITDIGEKAFASCHKVSSITIGNGVETIGHKAFYYCTDLSSITIGANVKCIWNGAFSYCSELTAVVIPDGVKNISDELFYECTGLTSITFGNSTEAIGQYAFYNCNSLINIKIPDSTKKIDYAAFCKCAGLTSVTIGKNVDTIEEYAFGECNKITNVYISDLSAWCNVTTNSAFPKSYNLYLNGNIVRRLEIPEDVQEINRGVFYNCTSITTVVISNGVTTIGESAFAFCTNMSSITIPCSITNIERNAFYTCSGLKGVYISDLTAWCNIDFFADSSNPLFYAQNLYINNQLVTDMLIPDDVNIIRKYAFINCTNFHSVTIPDSVVVIENWAFYGDVNLATINLPDSFADLGVEVFDKTAWYVEQPEGLVYIANVAYKYKGTAPDVVVLNNKTTGIAGGAFAAKKLTSITIPDSVTVIGEGAFSNCSTLAEIKIPSSVVSIGGAAFQYCSKLTRVEIPDSVKYLGVHIFYQCGNLNAVSIGKGVEVIDDRAFEGCSKLKKVVFRGEAPKMTADSFANTKIRAYYPSYDTTWSDSVRQNYGGTITWTAYNMLMAVDGEEYMYFSEALAACGEGHYIKLLSDATSDTVLSKDLYIDLNGYDLSGTLVTNGYKVYGMDSTTDSYTCEKRGVFSCVDENSNPIVPVTHFKSDITGSVKRYMAIKEDSGYSFHRFYLGITHINLRPSTAGVGFKALFCGDEMVISMLDASEAFGYSLGLEGYGAATAYKGRESFVSGRHVTLRIDNYDIENFGETALTAKAMLKLSDGTVIESAAATMTFRQLLESLDRDTSGLTAQQLQAVIELISKYAIVKTWNLNNLLG